MRQTEKINEHIWRIPVSQPIQGDVFVYVINYNKVTLIDCGHPSSDSQSDLISGLAAAGLTPQDINQIILTHRHIDHVGGLVSHDSIFDKAEVIAYPGPEKPIVSLDTLERIKQYIPQECVNQIIDGTTTEMNKNYYQYHRPLHINTFVKDGDSINIGEEELKIMFTPGHSPDHISLLHKKTGTLLGGDILLHNGPPSIHHLDLYMNSLNRLDNCEINKTLPGHGPVIFDHKETINQTKKRIEMTDQRIIEAIYNGSQTPYDLALQFTGGKVHRGVRFFIEVVLTHLERLYQNKKLDLHRIDQKIERAELI
jgi:glyoxylase-like metal-dependent hydrolase (beta-lactamase superfamily II)